MNGKSIFIKYWMIGEPMLSNSITPTYDLSILPGLKEGVSGSMLLNYNIGINKHINMQKQSEALEVIKFITSREYQKKLFMNGYATSRTELMEDEESCRKARCDFLKGIQFTGEPHFIKETSNDYRKKYKNYIYEYVYDEENKVSIEQTLKKINDISKFYYISLKKNDSFVGLICFIFISVLSILMVLSLITLFNISFQPFFMFLPFEFWIITVLGSVIIIWIPFVNYGPIEIFKCQLKPFLLSVGFTFNLCPILYKMLCLFPEKNIICTWVNKHKYLFLLINIFIDILLNSMSIIHKYTIKNVMNEDGESFQICNYSLEYVLAIPTVYKLLLMLLLLFLVFVEWSIKATLYDVRFIMSALYIDLLSIILIIVFFHIRIKNYIIYFVIQTLNMSIISIGNYIFLYGIRVFLGLFSKRNVKLRFINNINEQFINNETRILSKSLTPNDPTFKSSETCNNNNNNNRSEIAETETENNTGISPLPSTNFILRMINYHYAKDSNSYTESNGSTTTDTSNILFT